MSLNTELQFVSEGVQKIPTTFEIVTPRPCLHALPDPSAFPVGEIVKCRKCKQKYRRGVTWWWRDPVWRYHIEDFRW